MWNTLTGCVATKVIEDVLGGQQLGHLGEGLLRIEGHRPVSPGGALVKLSVSVQGDSPQHLGTEKTLFYCQGSSEGQGKVR